MPKQKSRSPTNAKAVITGVYNAIDISTAILILSGQITSTGVFVSPHGFWLSLTGPILGGVRYTGRSPATTAVLDAVDVVAALLLIIGQLTVTGPWISSGSFNIVISGPAFGVTRVPVPSVPNETTQAFCDHFRQHAVNRFMSFPNTEQT